MNERPVDDLKNDSLPDLLRQLANETTTLIQQEIALAKVEVGEKVKTASSGAVYFGGAAVLAVGAFGALTAMFIELLALVLQVWAAALIVTLVYAVIAAGFVAIGRNKLKEAGPVVPQQTAQTVKEDVEWVKTRAQSSRK